MTRIASGGQGVGNLPAQVLHADPRWSGFGLNFHRGFGSRSGPFGLSSFGAAMQMGQAAEDRRLQERMAGMREAGDTQRAQIAARASMLPARLQQQRFNRIFPMLRSSYLDGESPHFAGGQSGPGPAISTGPIWTDQQIQEQINAARAGNEAATQGRITSMQRELAGRGFGGSSPLAQALAGQAMAAGMAANTASERQARFDAARDNAAHVLRAQSLAEQQFANRMQEDIERRRPYIARQNAIIAALGSLV